jgi:phosphoribosylaminoimidazole carboxylase PurE protein
MAKDKVRVLLVVGSASDVPTMKKAAKVLEEFGVGYELTVASAHRSPARAEELATKAAGRGIKVIVAGAGLAAHLAGAIAARTGLPVIGVPMAGGPLNGLDALLSTVQMPPGVPVATVAIGEAGAVNAAYLAVRILALSDPDLARKAAAHRERMAAAVEEAAQAIAKDKKP